jgi:glucose/arabinose dehydrogenase
MKSQIMRLPVLGIVFLALSTAALAQDARVELRQIASGLEMPVAIAHANDNRLFITLQRGTVVIYDGTSVLPAPFLDIRAIVECCGEQGLLSIAFHPRYRDNGFFYAYYVETGGANLVIARYRVSADANRADPTSGTILLRIPHPTNSNHNGGQLQFGPDGFLYIGTGDGGAGGDPPNNAQNLNVLLGKLLRIDVDSGNPYTIPPSNPSFARREIWAYGLRNPWRFTFDRVNGDLFIADVGQGLIEEVDLQRASSIGGENYGWRRMEGTRCFNPSTNCNDGTLVRPIIEYDHSNGACSVTGGYRYRGTEFPRLGGMYIYADFCNGVMSGATERSDGTWATRTLIDTNRQVSTFGEDVRGELYLADYGGRLFRIVDANPAGPRRRGVRR